MKINKYMKKRRVKWNKFPIDIKILDGANNIYFIDVFGR